MFVEARRATRGRARLADSTTIFMSVSRLCERREYLKNSIILLLRSIKHVRVYEHDEIIQN